MFVEVLLIAFFLLFLYKSYTAIYKQWEERGIPYIPATFPFGSSIQIPLFIKSVAYVLDEMYQEMEGKPYFGMFTMRQPQLVLRDPEMVKLVLAKEFSHFRDRTGINIPKQDYMAQHLFNMEGEAWRALRVKMSPTFTSGKLKGMFQHFTACSEVLDNYLLSKVDRYLDVKDICARFTTDIICSCAFGLEVNSIDNSEEEFRKIGASFSKTSLKSKIRGGAFRTFPKIMELLGVKVTSKKTEEFITKVIKQSIEHRDKNKVSRNDFLDLMMQLRNKNDIVDDMTVNEEGKPSAPIDVNIEMIAAQCFVFFFAGFETSSSVQSFCLYELALHPEIQDRLVKEINTVIAKHGALTYQAVLEMEYLDMVISETMRKYPTLVVLTRRCTKPFVTPAGHRIEKGDIIVIPIWSLHHDPNFFPKPDSFDPERFLPENKGSIVPYTYLPFGEGPRICIGMRFGILQTKMGIITILRRFIVEPSENMQIPLKLVPNNLLSITDSQIIVKVTERVPA